MSIPTGRYGLYLDQSNDQHIQSVLNLYQRFPAWAKPMFSVQYANQIPGSAWPQALREHADVPLLVDMMTGKSPGPRDASIQLLYKILMLATTRGPGPFMIGAPASTPAVDPRLLEMQARAQAQAQAQAQAGFAAPGQAQAMDPAQMIAMRLGQLPQQRRQISGGGGMTGSGQALSGIAASNSDAALASDAIMDMTSAFGDGSGSRSSLSNLSRPGWVPNRMVMPPARSAPAVSGYDRTRIDPRFPLPGPDDRDPGHIEDENEDGGVSLKRDTRTANILNRFNVDPFNTEGGRIPIESFIRPRTMPPPMTDNVKLRIDPQKVLDIRNQQMEMVAQAYGRHYGDTVVVEPLQSSAPAAGAAAVPGQLPTAPIGAGAGFAQPATGFAPPSTGFAPPAPLTGVPQTTGRVYTMPAPSQASLAAPAAVPAAPQASSLSMLQDLELGDTL